MTTITKEFTKEQLIAKAQEQIAFCRDTKITGEGRTHVNQCSALFEIALASLDAKPIGAFHIADQQVEGTSDYIKDGEWPIDNGIIEVYAASPAQEAGVYKDMLNIVDLLENNEWAEHCTSTLLGSHLESEITRLIGKEQPVPVVPEEMPKGLAGQIVSLLTHNIGDKFLAQKIWSACRAAMLQGAEPVSQTYKLPELTGDNEWINRSNL
ncbi:protein Eaa [Salmonella enterica]|uniref:protein Eaa n=1 Tax=Salmonella enterica TaxID=28901 RepID=UPI001EF05148|nr:protein Eaa [Salmonella enterica]